MEAHGWEMLSCEHWAEKQGALRGLLMVAGLFTGWSAGEAVRPWKELSSGHPQAVFMLL